MRLRGLGSPLWRPPKVDGPGIRPSRLVAFQLELARVALVSRFDGHLHTQLAEDFVVDPTVVWLNGRIQ